jgi:hypothetical protein
MLFFSVFNQFFSANLRILNLQDSAGNFYAFLNNSFLCLFFIERLTEKNRPIIFIIFSDRAADQFESFIGSKLNK